MSAAFRLFDHVLKSYPKWKRVSPTASIVEFPALEVGLVKLQRQAQLTTAERHAA